ncbi:MAG: SH3 domain-containing protein [Robiginitomaculum sp.]|nr:SH3 domain-containing protein [Robiginitomaculum sp.]
MINSVMPKNLPKPWLTENKRTITPIKPKQVPAPIFTERKLTRIAGSPPLRFFETSENLLADLTWNLSDWDRAILDGDIQRVMNKPKATSLQWVASNPELGRAVLNTGPTTKQLQELKIRRLHILNKTPKKVIAVSGQWRSWRGSLLRAAPTKARSKIIGRLAPASKVQVLAKVQGITGEYYFLIAVKGTGVGYVSEIDLSRLKGITKSFPGARPSFNRAVNLDFAPTLRDPVEAIVSCRILNVEMTDIQACRGLDGRWRAL